MEEKKELAKAHAGARIGHSASYHAWNHETLPALRKSLLTWFHDVSSPQRAIPWRQEVKATKKEQAYRVWISEIMCQQTQVMTVIKYFTAWMEKFPTVKSLADAPLESIHQQWKGLGYYSRATRIHDAAKQIANSSFPEKAKEMQSLPGIGTYTANAIASIVFDEPVAAIDGNFTRVLSRLLAIHASPANAVLKKQVGDLYAKLADELVKADSGVTPGSLNQAVFDLGALICTPTKPKCSECPISEHCKALEESTAAKKEVDIELCNVCLPSTETPQDWFARYPPKPPKKAKKTESHTVLILQHGHQYLLQKRGEKGLLAGLWQFPFIESSQFLENVKRKEVGCVTHQFSHITWTLDVCFASIDSADGIEMEAGYEWVSYDHLKKEAISTAFVKCWSLAIDACFVVGNIGADMDASQNGKGVKRKKHAS